MNIAENVVVLVNYTLTNGKGDVLDKTEGEPLGFIQGSGMLLPKLEEALLGKSAGDELTVNVSPEDAFGERDNSRVEKVPRSEFDGIDDLKEGIELQVQGPNGVNIVTVADITDTEVTVDLNHPLAGETLNFDISIVSVREATAEELDHGHVHGEGGHKH